MTPDNDSGIIHNQGSPMNIIRKETIDAWSTILLVEAYGALWCVEMRGGKVHSVRNNTTDKAMRRNSAKFLTLASFVEYRVAPNDEARQFRGEVLKGWAQAVLQGTLLKPWETRELCEAYMELHGKARQLERERHELLEALDAMYIEFASNFPDGERMAVDLCRAALSTASRRSCTRT